MFAIEHMVVCGPYIAHPICKHEVCTMDQCTPFLSTLHLRQTQVFSLQHYHDHGRFVTEMTETPVTSEHAVLRNSVFILLLPQDSFVIPACSHHLQLRQYSSWYTVTLNSALDDTPHHVFVHLCNACRSTTSVNVLGVRSVLKPKPSEVYGACCHSQLYS